MSTKFLNTIEALYAALNKSERDTDKIGVLARALRWYNHIDAEDMEALLVLGEKVQQWKGAGCWEVERAVLEIHCSRAAPNHTHFLINSFRKRGKQGDTRRRLAMHALSTAAAHLGDDKALFALAEGLKHHKKDTRGWAIGFLIDAYMYLDRPLPPHIINQLTNLAETDPIADVRVEAVKALAEVGLANNEWVEQVVAKAINDEPN